MLSLVVNQEQFVESLAQFRHELREAEERAQIALSEAEALRKIIEGIEELVEGRSMQLPLHETAGSNGGPPRPTPRGKDAVRQILIDSPRVWKVGGLTAEVQRRGWMEPDAKAPQEAVRNSLMRLIKAGEVEKVGWGMYRYRTEQLPPENESEE